jgi:hypothetical protein
LDTLLLVAGVAINSLNGLTGTASGLQPVQQGTSGLQDQQFEAQFILF